MKPLMKTWKIIVNVILGAFGILAITVSTFGIKTMNQHPQNKSHALYAFAIFMIVIGSLCCLGVIIWVTTDLIISIKNPNNAYDEKGYYSKYKIKKYKNYFSPATLPTLNKNKLNNNDGYFANDLKYTNEYLVSQNSNNTKKTVTKVDKIEQKIAMRKNHNTKKQTKNKRKKAH